jgi:cytochrome b involved in lipid metabolism
MPIMKRLISGVTVLLLTILSASSAFAATFTIDQISKHGTANDCYMAINGKVYDVTSFFGSHPGGDPNLLMGCGKDATSAFETKGGNGADHSQRAYKLLAQYYIGDLANAAPAQFGRDTVVGNTVHAKSGIPMRYPLVIPIFVAWVVLLFVYHLLTKKFPQKVNKATGMKITSITMLICFIGVASGGIYMSLFGRIFVNGMDAIVFHVYFGFAFVLGALTHIYLHWKEILLYLKKILRR